MPSSDDSLPGTVERVPAHTSARVNRRIRRQTIANLAYFAAHPDEIERRLRELDREWDIERTLEANAAGFSLLGLALAITADRRWLLLPTLVAGFLMLHALQGWCPPVPAFRSMGVRTAREIDEEYFALRYLRGDFGTPPPADHPPIKRARLAYEAVAG